MDWLWEPLTWISAIGMAGVMAWSLYLLVVEKRK